MFVAFALAALIAPFTAPPSVMPSPHPTASPTPYATQPIDYDHTTLDVRLLSPTRVAVDVRPLYRNAIGIRATSAGTSPTPSPTPSPRPTPYNVNEAGIITLSITSPTGEIETLLAEDVDRTFHLPAALPPSEKPYILTARWRDAPTVSTSITYLVSDVPELVGTHAGDPYIASDDGSYHTGTLFRLLNLEGPDVPRRFALQSDPSVQLVGDDYVTRGIVPAVNDQITRRLSKEYRNVRVQADGVRFACMNARRAVGRGMLLPGKTLHIVAITRAAHAIRLLRNDLRAAPLSLCSAGCDGISTFVDSPLIVRLAFDPADVSIIQPMYISGNSNDFRGACESGYEVVQDEKQFRSTFAIAH